MFRETGKQAEFCDFSKLKYRLVFVFVAANSVRREVVNAVDANLRSTWTLVAFHAGCSSSHHRSLRAAGRFQSKAALVCDCGSGNRGGGSDYFFQNASHAGRAEL